MEPEFKLRTQTHIVATRMSMYQRREKWQAIIAKQMQGRERVSTSLESVLDGIKPRAVVVEIVYPEIDRSEPATDGNLFDKPGVTIREISVDDGLTLKEFTLSLEEARTLAKLLANNL